MCGRFTITHPNEALADLFDAVPSNDLPEGERYNVCPTQEIAVVTSEEGHRRLRPMRWGFLPHWYKRPTEGPLLINARADTIAKKPAFRAAVRERRCIVPASGFYEWTKGDDGGRLPWYVRRRDGALIAFAGIWQGWERDGTTLTTAAIVTTDANRGMSAIHHRMPVILEREDWPLWLGEAGQGAAALMRPAGEAVLEWHRVDPKVNSNRAQGAELIAPVDA